MVGDSRTGETGKFDGPYFTLTAMERVPSPGLFLKIGSGRNPANVVPVDFVTEALARLSVAPGSRGLTYHLADPAPLSAFEGAVLAKMDLQTKALDTIAWRAGCVLAILVLPMVVWAVFALLSLASRSRG